MIVTITNSARPLMRTVIRLPGPSDLAPLSLVKV